MLIPSPATAEGDDANHPDCWGVDRRRQARVCTVVNPPGARRHLFALGDSHSNTLLTAYRMIGEKYGWRIDAAGNRGCYLTTAAQVALTPALGAACQDWVASVIAHANAGGFDGFVVTHLARSEDVTSTGAPRREVVDGLVGAWKQLPALPIVAIRDNPSMAADVVACVEANGLADSDVCARPRTEAVVDDGQQEAAQQVPTAQVVDLTDLYCSALCPPVIGHVLVYRDRTHLTQTWTKTLAPYLGPLMDRAFVVALAVSQPGRR